MDLIKFLDVRNLQELPFNLTVLLISFEVNGCFWVMIPEPKNPFLLVPLFLGISFYGLYLCKGILGIILLVVSV